MVQERSERTRGRLVEAGAVLFDRCGYAGATLGEIAGAAGVTKGALYFHFVSKEELAQAVFQQAERLLRRACGALRATSSPLQALIDLGHWLVDALESDAVVRAAFRLGREGGGWQPQAAVPPPGGVASGALVAGMRGFHGVWAGVVRDLLTGARRAGELRERTGALGPETLVVAAACGLEVVFGDGCPGEERALRVGALWEWLLPCLVPPGSADGYRTRPLAPLPG
ncbi:AcrR family transcriptional regulator [Kitasatospora sp. MAA19]|uniref:ScbR family autoregulator-binding transcription factor n=1 Tax=unclassified Kitasatospora TaxID=2633591 RepID=UPI00247518E7|nr:ScbR family autoregulator-binding transcription factor [Kitasatospora sp. MAA19]MDH6708135.1 AcrR family transcriptional regulator [Kitasatospora sp. MAA19]